MANELAIYDKVTDPQGFVKEIGKSIYLSGLFGCTSQAQGEVFALQCTVERLPPLTLKRKYHVIQNELSMRADAMLADFRFLGGKHKVISQTPDLASLELSSDGETKTFSLSWEEAQQEPFPFGKEGKLKKNWSTPRARMQMLWARVVSQGVRTMKPEVCSGSYTPEEIVDLEENARHEKIPVVVDPLEVIKKANESLGKESVGEPIDAEFVVVNEAEKSPVANTAAGGCNEEHRKKIIELFLALDIDADGQDKVLRKRGVSSARSLTATQAEELIASLTKALASSQQPPTTPPESSEITASINGPAGEVLAGEIRGILAEINDPKLIEKVQKHLKAHGKALLAELTHSDAIALRSALQAKNIEAFFVRTLA